MQHATRMFPHQPTAFKNKIAWRTLHEDSVKILSFSFKNQEHIHKRHTTTHFQKGKGRQIKNLCRCGKKKRKCRAGVCSGNFSNNHHSSRHPVLHTSIAVQHSCWRQEFQTWRWSAIETDIDTSNLSWLSLHKAKRGKGKQWVLPFAQKNSGSYSKGKRNTSSDLATGLRYRH